MQFIKRLLHSYIFITTLILSTAVAISGCSSGSSSNTVEDPPPPPPPPAVELPPLAGVFALTNGGDSANIDSEVMEVSQSEYIHGVSLRASWSLLEPAQGVMDFSLLDNRVQIVTQSGKKVKLILLGGALTPDWVYDELDVEFFEFEDRNNNNAPARNPAFWTDKYLIAYENYVAQVFEHYNNMPDVVGITIAGPSVKTAEMNFNKDWPRCQNETTPENNLCITEDRWIQSWQRSIDFFALYSETNYGIAINIALYDETASDAVIDYALGVDNGRGQFFIQWNGFKESADINNDYSYNRIASVYQNQLGSGFQWIWNVSCQTQGNCKFDAGDLLSSYQKAHNEAQVDFVEVYQQDILNADLFDAVQAGFELFDNP